MPSAAHVSFPADGVGMVLMDDPPKNFGSYELLARIEEGVEEVKAAGARVLLLASDVPGYFMAHAWLPDVLNAYEGGKPSGDPRLWRRLTNELERGPLISISVNHAQAWGGGAELSWACNLRVAGESATYCQVESILGVIPGGGGTVRLSRLVGQSKAMEILLAGEPMTAEELHTLGLVNKIFPDDDLRAGAIAWGALIATRPQWSLQACKRGLLQAWDMHFEDACRIENYIFNSMMRPRTIEIMRKIQDRYDAGADSWEAYDLQR